MKYTKEYLAPLVKDSINWWDLCKKVNIKPGTGAQARLKKLVKKYELDSSHIKFKVSYGAGIRKVNDIELYLIKNSTVSSHRLKLKLFRAGIKTKQCEHCGLTKWLEEESIFELDHIDCDPTNNTIKNLQILCPNCHALITRKRRKERKKRNNYHKLLL